MCSHNGMAMMRRDARAMLSRARERGDFCHNFLNRACRRREGGGTAAAAAAAGGQLNTVQHTRIRRG